MKTFRIIFLFFSLVGIVGTTYILIKEEVQPPFSRTLAPLFQELGKPIKSIDRTISKLFPVNEIDEKMLGEEIRGKLQEIAKPQDEEDTKTVKYFNSLIHHLTDKSEKPFEYTVFLFYDSPNAFALPGGVIGITKELLDLLENEGELVAILSHEIGHIERGHLFDAARSEMVRRKINRTPLAIYADTTIHMLARLTFSKTQEDEADEYGFQMLLQKGYNPFAMAESFKKIQGNPSLVPQTTSPLEDFFATHPYIKFRIEKFRSRASLWMRNHPKSSVYIGKRNFEERRSRFEIEYPEEFLETK